MIRARILKIIDGFKQVFQDKYAQTLMFIFSLLFGLAKSLSEFVHDMNEVNVDLCQASMYTTLCYFLLNFIYCIIKFDYKVKPFKIKYPKTLCFIFFGIFFAIYTVCWLNYWPGTMFIDNVWIMKFGMMMARQHPILYVSFVLSLFKLSMWLGGLNYGIAIYTGLQVLAISAFMASLFFSIFQRRIPRAIKFILLISCVALPIYALYAVASTKDVYWSICLSGLTILIYRLVLSPEEKQSKKFWFLFNIYLLGVVLLRNNGIHISLLNLVFLLWLFPKQREMLIKSLCVVLIAFFLMTAWLKLFDIEQMFKEKVAIPLQQIGAVVKEDGNLSSEQKEFISKVIPLNEIKKRYYPYSADLLKWGKSGISSRFLNSHSAEFMKVWFEIVKANPKSSLLSYLLQVYWFWAPSDEGDLNLVNTTLPEIPYATIEAMDWVYEQGYVRRYIFSPAVNVRLEIKYYNKARHFWHEGTLFWILAGCALLYFLKQRKLKPLIIYLPVFSLWGILMVAVPIHYFRYVLTYIYLLPFFIAILFTDKNEKGDKELYIFKDWDERVKKCFKWGAVCLFAFVSVWASYSHIINNIPRSARVDIYAHTQDKLFKVYFDNKGDPLKETSWMPKNGNRGVAIRRYNNSMDFSIYAMQDAEINIDLLGPSVRDKNGERYEKWVRFTDFRIDGRKILDKDEAVWHDKPFNYVLNAKKGHLYKVKVKWRKN